MGFERRRVWIVLFLLAFAAGANLLGRALLRYSAAEDVDLEQCPSLIAEWRQVASVPFDENTIAVLNPTSYIYRRYKRPDAAQVDLCIVYHRDERWGAHHPQICYTSQGWEMMLQGSRETTRLLLEKAGIKVNKFIVNKGGERRLVFYWFFSSGDKQTASRTAQMLHGLKIPAVRGHSPSGFVMLDIPIGSDKDYGEEERSLIDFAESLAPVLIEFV